MLKKSISEILLSQAVITKEQKTEYEASALEESLNFEEYVHAHELVSDTDLAKAYAKKFELSFIKKISDKMADPELLSKVSLQFLRMNGIIPIILEGDTIFLTSNPFEYRPLDELASLLGIRATIAVAAHSTIIEGINRYYPLEGTKEVIEKLEEEKELEKEVEFGEIAEGDILAMATEAPIIKLVNHILYQAVKRDASDVHIEPFEKELQVRYRIDGILYQVLTPPKRVQAAVSSRIKIMANLNIAEKRQPQDGRIQIKIADKAFDIRVSILPVIYGERIVMRILDKTRTFGNLQALGFSDRDFKVLQSSISRPNGIVLVTGPTGSGKTSTLYSIIGQLNKPGVNIVTVEDPVEYQMNGIGQVAVKDKIGLNFAAALRSILRQDPDIIMIGETRDQETAQIAIQAALTGHLVFTTLHTNSASAAVTRLIDMGIEPFLIASTVTSVMGQRLVRKLCKHCKKIYKPEADVLKKLGIPASKSKGIKFYQAVGCDECMGVGYKGRLAIFEIMEMTDEIMRLTLERTDTALIQKQARKDGMTLLIEDGVNKIIEGLTTIEEVLSVAAI